MNAESELLDLNDCAIKKTSMILEWIFKNMIIWNDNSADTFEKVAKLREKKIVNSHTMRKKLIIWLKNRFSWFSKIDFPRD